MRIILYCFLIFITSDFISAQEVLRSQNDLIREESDNSVNYNAAGEVFNLRNMLIFSGITGACFLLDREIEMHSYLLKRDDYDGITNISNNFGETSIMLPSLAGAFSLGAITKNQRLTDTSVNSAKSFIAGASVVETLKAVTGRKRPPVAQNSNLSFEIFEGYNIGSKSFPSWHTFVASSIITPFAEEYSRWLYIIPISTGFARIYLNRHWLSDVAAGGGIGFLSGLYFHKRKKQNIIFTGNGIIFNL